MRVVLTVAVLAVAAACGVEVSDDAGITDISGGGVVGPVDGSTTSTTPPTTAPPPADLEIEGADDSVVNDTAANAIVDIEQWWTEVYPEIYGEPYEEISGGFYAVDERTEPSGLPCAPDSIDQVLWNAYYCSIDDGIAWDQQYLMPDLAETYGEFTVAVVLAHEWGHAIQARAAVDEPTVVTELQADCFAGAWVRHVEDDDDTRFDITTTVLDEALAGVLSLRDAPGQLATDPNAHGSGFDRVTAFQEGFEQGAQTCSEYTMAELDPYQFPFTDDDEFASGGDMPYDEINVEAFKSLEAYWEDAFPEISDGEDWKPLEDPVAFDPDDPPTCDGKAVDQYRLFYCVPDRYVGFDEEETLRDAYELGDFAVASLYGTQYGLAVQEQLGTAPDNEVTATLRGDCYSGAWAGALLAGTQGEADAEKYVLVLSPGDLDEAVSTLLSFRTESDRQRQGPGFERVKAFRAGVVDGPEACADVNAEG